MRNSSRLLMASLAVFVLGGCGLGPSGKARLQVSMPPGGLRSNGAAAASYLSAQRPEFDFAAVASSSASKPSDISGFTCFAVLVTGEGVNTDPAMSTCKAVDANGQPFRLGVFGGFQPVQGGVVDVEVPGGPARKIYLIALTSSVGCKPFAEAVGVNPDGTERGKGLGEPYLLGTVEQDIFADQTISMKASYDAATAVPLFECSEENRETISLTVQDVVPHFTSSGDRVRVSGTFSGAALESGGSVALYTDSSCKTPITNVVHQFVAPGKFTVSARVPAGATQVYARAYKDSERSRCVMAGSPIARDAAAPHVAINSVLPGQQVASAPTITVSGECGPSSAVLVSLSINGGAAQTCGACSGGQFACSPLAVSSLPQGELRLTATAALGNALSDDDLRVTNPHPPATGLEILTTPSSSAVAGQAFAQVPVVQVVDTNGSAVPHHQETVIAAPFSDSACTVPAGTLANAAVTPVNGVATFGGLSYGQAGTIYLKYISGGLQVCGTTPIAVGAGAVSLVQTSLTLSSTTFNAGGLGTVVITLKDAGGNVVADNTQAANLDVQVENAGTSSGTVGPLTPVSGSDGVYQATFTATTAGTPNSLKGLYLGTPLNPHPVFTVSPGPAAQLAVVQEPSNVMEAGASPAVVPRVAVQDAHGNQVTSSSVAITAQAVTTFIDSANCTGTAPGTLGSPTVNAVNGLATFNGIHFTKAMSIFLRFSAPGLGQVCGSTQIAVSHGPLDHLSILTEAGTSAPVGGTLTPQPAIKLLDQFGNPVVSHNQPVIAEAFNNPTCSSTAVSPVSGNSAPSANGLASFSSLTFGAAGSVRFRYSTGGKSVCGSVSTTFFDPVTITPTTLTFGANSSFVFSATGGVGALTFSVLSGGGTIDPVSGMYTAPSTPGSATIKVQDVTGQFATADVTINPPLAIAPSSSTIAVGNTVSFLATGGAGGYVYSLVTGTGVVNASTGQYTAPGTAGTATVRVTDTMGYFADATVTINAGLSFLTFPSGNQVAAGHTFTFQPTGGVPPYAFSMDSGPGTVDPISGDYTSQTPGSVQVKVLDSIGNSLIAGFNVFLQISVAQDGRRYSVGDSVALTPSGGSAPYNWSIESGGGSVTSPAGVYTAALPLGPVAVKVVDGTGAIGYALLQVIEPVQVAAGVMHSCARFNDGSVKCWGSNEEGQLGIGTSGSGDFRGDVSGELGDALPFVDLGAGRSATSIAAGGWHSCAILDDGSVKCWGYGQYGQLGHGSTSALNAPGPTVNLGGNAATQLAMGPNFSCALLANGTVQCWGDNGQGQLGRESSNHTLTPFGSPIDLGDTAKGIFAGPSNVCAILGSDRLRCWGNNSAGQLGTAPDGNTNWGDGTGETVSMVPEVELGLNGLSQPLKVVGGSLGALHACAVTEDENGLRKLKCWGYNGAGQLAHGTTSTVSPPVNFSNIEGTSGVTVSRYDSSYEEWGCSTFSDGRIKCWGNGAYGQLGHEATSNLGATTPSVGDNLPFVNLGSGRTVLDLATGAKHSCALLDNKSVKCWGEGLYGKLGSGQALSLGDDAGEMGNNLPAVKLTGIP